jgi:hypothetical protein
MGGSVRAKLSDDGLAGRDENTILQRATIATIAEKTNKRENAGGNEHGYAC